jgi:hypothetical protein
VLLEIAGMRSKRVNVIEVMTSASNASRKYLSNLADDQIVDQIDQAEAKPRASLGTAAGQPAKQDPLSPAGRDRPGTEILLRA